MATLTYNGESFTVDHAVKGADYINGYDANGILVVSFDGVADFSCFSYDGSYMSPSDCLAEPCNEMVYCGGKAKTRGGADVPASAFGAAAANHGNHVPTTEKASNNRFLRNDNTWQTVTPGNIGAAPAIESADHPGCYYRMVGNEREWINPPLVIGTEYRTTERYGGAPVYTFLFDAGFVDASTTTVAHGLAVKTSLSIELVNQNEVVTNSGGINNLNFNSTNIYWDADWAMGGAKFTLKYTK